MTVFLTAATSILWFYITVVILAFILNFSIGCEAGDFKESLIDALKISAAITCFAVAIIISITVANFLFFGG